MRPDLLLIEKIEKYIEGSLSANEHAAFEKQMAKDADLQSKVAFQKMLLPGIARADMKVDIVKASLKYKKIALLSKIAIWGGSSIVGVTATIAIASYVGNNNQKMPTNYTPTAQTITIDSIETKTPKDSLSIEKQLIDSTTITSIEKSSNVTTSSIEKEPKKTISEKSEKENNTKLADLFWKKGTTLTWLGMDYTECRFYGTFSENTDDIFYEDSKIANKSFNAWNDIYISEKKKYDFRNAFNTEQIPYFMDVTNKRNDTINTKRLSVSNENDLNHFNQNKISKIIESYELKDKEGLGLLFMFESLNKTKQKSAVWVTIIDMKTKKVLLTEKMMASPSGIGTKNYWSHSFYTIIKSIESKKYNEWKTAYKN